MVERMGLENGPPTACRVVSPDTSRSCNYRRVRGEVGTRGTRWSCRQCWARALAGLVRVARCSRVRCPCRTWARAAGAGPALMVGDG